MQTGPGDKPTGKAPKKSKPKPAAPSEVRDVKSDADRGRATKYKKTSEYRGAVRAGYKGNQNRSQAVRDNVATARKKGTVPEQAVVVKTHLDNMRGAAKGDKSRAVKDTKGNDQRKRAIQYLADHPEILKPKKKGQGGTGTLGFIDNALSGKLTAGAVSAAKGISDAAAPYAVAAARGPIGFVGDQIIKKVTGADIEKGLTSAAKPIGRDVVDIPASAIPSLYLPAREVASGHPEKAAKMLLDPFVQTAKHPLKSLKEHPVGTVLLASGAKGAVGHGAGKALRTAPSARLKQAGSVERTSATIPNANTRIREDRTYSKDAITKAGQVLRDKRRAAKGQEPVGGHVTEADISRRTNERVAANEDIRRSNRAAVVHDARTALDQRGPMAKLKGKRPSAATSAAAQHIADTPAELGAYLAHLKEAAKGLEGDKLRRNKETQGLIEKALKHPGRAARGAEQAARYRDLNLRIQKDLEATGIIDPKQMENRRLLSYATSPAKGMNARMLKPHETEAHVATATKVRDTAKKGLKKAKRELAQAKVAEGEAVGRAQVLSRNVDGTNAAESAARSGNGAAGGYGIRQAASRRAAAEAKVAEFQSEFKHADKQLSKARKSHQQGGHLVREVERPPVRPVAADKIAKLRTLAERGATAGEREAARTKLHQAVRDSKPTTETIRVTSAHIRAHMHANGVKGEGAYVTHAPGKRGARNFFVDTSKPPGYFGPKATGAAVKEGTLDLHPEALVESAAHAQGLVDSAHRFRAFVDEFAHRKENGNVKRFKKFQDAQDAAREMMVDKNGDPVPHAIEMTPVRINPLGGRSDQLRATLEGIDHADASTQITELLDNALSAADAHGPGDWALVPKKAADVQREHLGVGQTTAGKAWQMYSSQFRKVVLSLSPKWLTGNVAEAALRALVGHAGVRSWYTGHEAQKRHEALYGPEAAAELRSRTTGGGHYSLATRVDVRRGAEDFARSGAKLARFAEAMGKLRRAPGAKQVADTWDAYTHVVMQSLNGRLEHQFQTAMFGKALREHPLMADRTLKLTREAIDEAAAGLRDTNAQVRLGREVDRMYGRYSKFSPAQRKLIAGYTPFIAWSLNTVRFLFGVLPRDHPVLTSVLASANQASEEWRTQHGLIQSFVENLAGAKPSFLQGSIPGRDGSSLRASHFTPFGIYDQEGGLLGAFTNALLPQATGTLKNLSGEDWKGDNLKGKFSKEKPTQARDLLAAAMTVVENSVPLVAQGVDIAGVHAPNEADGTQHPDNVVERLRKRNDPFMYAKSGKPGGQSSLSTKDILSGKAKLPPLPPLPALPKTITIQVR